MLLRSVLALSLALFSFGQMSPAHQRTWPAKRLADTLPEAKKFTQKQSTLSAAQIDGIQKTLGESIRTEDKTPNFFIALGQDGKSIGVVLFVDATGENGKIEIGVAINPQGEVLHVVLFEQSENASLSTAQFLDQFKAKKAGDKFKIGEDVVAAKGSETGAKAIASAVKRALLITKTALNVGGK